MKRILVYEALSGGGLPEEALHGGDLLAQGLAMRDALVADLNDLVDYAVTTATLPGLPPPPGSAAAVSPRAGESACDFVARLAARHDAVWVVAPESDGLLSRLHGAVGAARWVGCSAAAIRLATSKSATTERLAAAGLLTPRAFAASPEVRRWVVKPDDGAGALASRVHSAHNQAVADLAERDQRGASAVLEPWVAGEALSLSLLCSAGQAELLSVNRQQIALDDGGGLRFEGVSVNAIGPADPRSPLLRATADQVARAIDGLSGFVGVDLVWHAQRGPVVVEINPRLTSAYVGLSAALQRNVAAAVLAARAQEQKQEQERAHADA
jgi:predicted ATP-grasp superfamily ATP-dependent carboligase